MQPAPRITVFGSLHMDIVVQAPRQPRLGETLAGSSWRPVPGGKGLNQAVHAARHGAAVRMVGRVGTDDFAGPLLAHLARHGVDARGVRRMEAAGTGMSVAIIEAAGDYAAVIVSGANQCVDGDDVAAVAAGPADLLLLQYEVAPAALAPAARAAKAAGARVVLNAAPAAPAPAGLLASVDLLAVNAIEAEMLSGMPVADLAGAHRALAALAAQVPAVVLTLGADGLLLAERGGSACHIPGHRVAVVDTHGAGDALIGALACRLAAGDGLAAAARYGNAAAALMVASAGADPAAITVDAVDALLAAEARRKADRP
ncbi:MAG: PfkB family carbohydrate kinase [Alphaproteobacteria bacterium]